MHTKVNNGLVLTGVMQLLHTHEAIQMGEGDIVKQSVCGQVGLKSRYSSEALLTVLKGHKKRGKHHETQTHFQLSISEAQPTQKTG